MISRYVELGAASAFSFLRAASAPEDLVTRAADLGYDALALCDRDVLSGAPRFFKTAKAAGVRAIVGAQVGPLRLLVRDRTGYRNLCRLLTEKHFGNDTLAEHHDGLLCLTRDATALDRLVGIFGRERVLLEIWRHLDADEECENQRLLDLARRHGLRAVATNDVRHARAEARRLFDLFACLREKTTLDAAGRLLSRNAERHMKSPDEMARLFSDLPDAVAAARDVADACAFTLADLPYRFPDSPLPPGETPASWLRRLALAGARDRYRPFHDRARAQIDRELALVAKLGLEGYFLIVHDIVRFCRERGILAQGRGSAANSAVCYALGITAVDPVGMDLLFERFLSEERGEWPDIDIDLPSGDRREEVIQYVYRRYGARGAAMTATVITWRARLAVREVGKVLGLPADRLDRLAKLLSPFEYAADEAGLCEAPAGFTPAGARGSGASEERSARSARAPNGPLNSALRAAGLDPDDARVKLLCDLAREAQGLPRHLSQHPGGMVIAAGRLCDVVPLQPAAMPGRVIIQWDKEDCADLGIIKVDLLGLGMMAVLEEAVARTGVDLAHLPPDDPATYAMIRRADTVGVFQIESRAQMATLPRMKPERFYDLVVEVAIIRPGPIVGQMVHPYLERRAGRQPVTVPHPSLAPILARTLGVPIFQEQLMRMAMVAAGFSGGQAEELRRAMGFRRSRERMDGLVGELRAGMDRNGIPADAQELILRSIRSFALYGFPECVVGETRVIDAGTGRLVAVEDVVQDRVSLRTTLVCDDNLRLRRRRVVRATSSGARPVFRLRTALGREIIATAEHPLLTVEGWRALGVLRAGDRVAVARALPRLGRRRWPRHALIVLADLIAEGNLCHPSTFYFYTTSARHRDEFVRCVERFPNTRATVARHRACFSVHVRRRVPVGRIGAVAWAGRLGIRGVGARDKRLPDEVFELRSPDLALLLARLWEGDGHLSVARHASYDTASRRLAEDIQHLLLRLGIVSRIYERTRPYRNRSFTGFTVTITGRDDLRRFYRHVARRFLDSRKRRFARTLARTPSVARMSRDIVPASVRAIIRRERERLTLTWLEIGRRTGLGMREIQSHGLAKRGFRRWVVARLARHLRSRDLERLASSDLYWDRVVSIEFAGVRQTYDLHIEGDHNFLANDFVVHNSHAASFALIAYASAYLKAHHPAAFTTALLNQWPMGFYHPATIVKDAERHGVRVLPACVHASKWRCTVEDGRVRLGLRYVKGLRREAAERIVATRPFSSVGDLMARAELRFDEAATLAEAGALAALGLTRRAALWQALRLGRGGPLLSRTRDDAPAPPPGMTMGGHPPVPEMTPFEQTAADFRATSMTTGPHPMAYLREALRTRGVVAAADLRAIDDGARVATAGIVIVRQRPGTAKGFLFLTLEDETGLANVIVTPPRYHAWRATLMGHATLLCEGRLQKKDGVIHLRAERFEALALGEHAAAPARDFR